MLRAVVALLLLANLVFFGWSQGWLAPLLGVPHQGEREPERLATQLHPELITVLAPGAASAALTAARATTCLEAGPVAETDLAAAEAALAPLPAGTWTREAAPAPPLWLVFAPRAGTGTGTGEAAARRAREAELRKLNLPFETLAGPAAPAEWAGALVLSRHASRAEAEAALASLPTGPATKGLRVAALPAPPAQWWLRVARADADLAARLRALAASAPAGGFKPCAERP
jgi:hypothetical protein